MRVSAARELLVICGSVAPRRGAVGGAAGECGALYLSRPRRTELDQSGDCNTTRREFMGVACSGTGPGGPGETWRALVCPLRGTSSPSRASTSEALGSAINVTVPIPFRTCKAYDMMNKMVEATELGPDIEWMFGLDNEKVLCERWLASAVALKDPIGWQVGYRRRQEGLGADRGRQGAHQGLRGRVDERARALPRR